MKKGSILEIDIENYAFEGKGVARIDDENSDKKFVIFAHGYPGDKLKVRIARKKKSYAEATVLEILEASPLRKKPDCNYFGVCGGCKTQDLEYSQQLLYKQEQVVDALRKIGGFEDLTVEPIVPADKTFFYRNKMEFSFTEKRWLTAAEINTENDISDQKFALGLHVPKVFEKVINIEECLLQSEISNRILNFTRDFFKTKETSIYSTFSHEGFLRNLVIRQSYFTDDLMVNLVTAYEDEKLITLYTNELLKKEPSITTIVNSINTKKAAVAFGEYHIKYFGDGFITDKIDDFQFRISPNSFFQTNSQQAESLYKTVLEFAELKSTDVVYDLYCGAGTISIFISKYVKQVFGFESVAAAIQDASVNNSLNKIDNTSFFISDLNKGFAEIINNANIPHPDIIITDPPRSGMHQNTIQDIINLNPPKIVYVSCNPATQARDIRLLNDSGYKIEKIRPVDMFPHTYHIENVVLLTR